jgi:hypothetical protein
MVVRKGEWVPVLFDGLRLKSIENAAILAQSYLEDFVSKVKPGEDLKFSSPIFASVPKQKDKWSCGHRLLLTMEYLLSAS